MSEQLQIDWAAPTGRELMERALAQVQEGQEPWIAQAMALLRRYLAHYAGPEFKIESFRTFAVACGLPAPRSHHAWGALPRLAVRDGLIEWTGRYEPATSVRTHGHPVRVYRVKAR